MWARPHTHPQAEHFIQCRTQSEQLQLLSKVINSKDTLEALERECGKEEAGGLLSGGRPAQSQWAIIRAECVGLLARRTFVTAHCSVSRGL